MRSTTTQEIRFKNPAIAPIPAGVECGLTFVGGGKASVIVGAPGRDTVKISCAALPIYFAKDFTKPTLEQLEAWSSDGVCESVTGDRVEPDGWGPDGAPSWLIALGMI